jgi:hypothetical protein
LAAQVAERSRATRQGVLDAIAAADAAGNRRRAHAEAERAVLVADRLDTAAVQRVARRLVRRLEGQGWVRRNDLRRMCAGRDRSFFDAAIDAAVAAGQVESQQVSYRGQDGAQYRTANR